MLVTRRVCSSLVVLGRSGCRLGAELGVVLDHEPVNGAAASPHAGQCELVAALRLAASARAHALRHSRHQRPFVAFTVFSGNADLMRCWNTLAPIRQ